MELLPQQIVGPVDVTPVVFRVQVNVNVAGELPVFVSDHGRSAREKDFGYFRNGNLSARGCPDQNTLQVLNVVPKVSVVTDVDRVALSAFDVFGDHCAADPGGDGLLNVRNRKSIASRFSPIHFDIQVKALPNALGENGTRFGDA